MTATQSVPEATAIPSRATTWILGLTVAAQFVLQLDFSIVNVALPTVQHDLHFSPVGLQWVVTGYALTFGSLLLVGGRLGDIAGHRRALVGGLVGFAITSLSGGLATSAGVLVASRLVQGASAALIAPAALGLLTHAYTEPRPGLAHSGSSRAAPRQGVRPGSCWAASSPSTPAGAGCCSSTRR